MKLIALAPNMMVENVDDTVDFYNKIGFETINSVKNDEGASQWAMVQTGNVRLMFQSKESLGAEIKPLKEMTVGATLNLYITMEGINALYQNIKDSTKVINKLAKSFYGANEFTIQDLNGYFITFAEHGESE